MKILKHPLLILWILFCTSCFADIRKFDIPTLEKLGRDIFEQDIRAATASDMLFALKIDPEKDGLKGWIVEGGTENMLVRFVRERTGKPEAYYDVKFTDKAKPVIEIPKDRTLTARQLALYKARMLGLQNVTHPATPSYNTITLPDPENEGILVYALASTDDPDLVVAGGHYRFSFDKTGEKLIAADALSKSPMVLKKRDPSMPKGSRFVSLGMSCLVSDTPLETHVYLNLIHNLDLSVIIPKTGQIWSISKGRISKMN